jgi:hypothetical protein
MRVRAPMPHCLAGRTFWVSGLLVAALGCVAVEEPTPQPRGVPAPHGRSPEIARQIQVALADAARRSGIEAAELVVDSAEDVSWLDGSLGCPAPDLMYTQALVPGYRIRIVAAGRTLDYHADTRGEMLLCPRERAVDPSPARR